MTNQNTNQIIIIAILSAIAILLSIYVVSLESENDLLKEKNDLFINIIEIEDKLYQIDEDYIIPAEEYYDLASEDYIETSYKGVINNCEKARDDYAEGGQKLREVRAEIKLKKQNDIFDLYIDLTEEGNVMIDNMYEACEYFESSAKYYDIYFNGNVSYDDPSYEMAGSELEMMNEKIEAHDESVERYNDILSELTIRILENEY